MYNLDKDTLRRLESFKGLGDEALNKLADNADIRQIKTGQPIIQKERDAELVHYLLQGSVEIRASFFDRHTFGHLDQEATKPLETTAGHGVAVNASSDCQVVKFFRTQIEAAETIPFVETGYTAIDRGASHDTYVVHDTHHNDDWLSRFLMSPMVGHLSAADIHRMLGAFTEVAAKKGELILERGLPGDQFYIVKSGAAVVVTDPNGPLQGSKIMLEAGDYFGEEALVGDTTRNARVVMASDGVLCAMDREFFDRVVRQAVVVTSPEEQVNHLLGNDENEQVLLDIRLYPEYRQGHREHSLNLPLSQLRGRLKEMDGSKQYFISPEGGSRSELATFIMRQAGFDAVLISSAS
jgi:CRP-like cAMP-binding protein